MFSLDSSPDVDFPADRLFRRLALWTRLCFAALLVGARLESPVLCGVASSSSFNFSDAASVHFLTTLCRARNSFAATPDSAPRFDHATYLPHLFIVEALAGLASSWMWFAVAWGELTPMLKEAASMGAGFPLSHNPLLQTSLFPPASISPSNLRSFVQTRFTRFRGFSIADSYIRTQLVVKATTTTISFVVGLALLRGIVGNDEGVGGGRVGRHLGYCTPTLSGAMGDAPLRCVFPTRSLSLVLLCLDILLSLFLLLFLLRAHFRFWRHQFRADLLLARRLVAPRTARRRRLDRLVDALSRSGGGGGGSSGSGDSGRCDVDDLRLAVALLHQNVDKSIANRLLIEFADLVDWNRKGSFPLSSGARGSDCGARCGCPCFDRGLRAKLRVTLPPWRREEEEEEEEFPLGRTKTMGDEKSAKDEKTKGRKEEEAEGEEGGEEEEEKEEEEERNETKDVSLLRFDENSKVECN